MESMQSQTTPSGKGETDDTIFCITADKDTCAYTGAQICCGGHSLRVGLYAKRDNDGSVQPWD